jgi:putative ABC transport system substrate-binding protein
MNPNLFRLFTAIFLALPPGAASQQPSKTARIGYISSFGTAPDSQIRAFREGLNDLGYFEGKNISIEFRHPKQRSEDVPSLIAELLQTKVDVLIALDPTAIRAAKQATQTVPIVMLTNQDPVDIGLVDSLARPGGNITGITRINRQLSGKRLEILTEIRPGSSRFGLLWVPPSALGTLTAFKSYTAAATALKRQIVSLQVNRSNPDLDGAFQAAAKERVGGVITVTNAAFRPHQAQIAALGIKHRMPTLCEVSDYVESGCLSSYATDDAESFRRAATYVDKILKGTKPADLPIEQPTKFELVINLKTARHIGLMIPPNVLARADRVIK